MRQFSHEEDRVDSGMVGGEAGSPVTIGEAMLYYEKLQLGTYEKLMFHFLLKRVERLVDLTRKLPEGGSGYEPPCQNPACIALRLSGGFCG